MRKILTIIKTFSFTHPVYVYENEDVIYTTSATTLGLDKVLHELANEYETTDVEMYGANVYTKGIKNKIEASEMTKYNKNILNIELK